jgi:predicted dehydrogenase
MPHYQVFAFLKQPLGKIFFAEGKYTLNIGNLAEGWRAWKDQSGGGCVLDMGYHFIDLVIWFLGLPDAVYSNLSASARPEQCYDVEDTADIHFSYNSGLHGSLIFSRCSANRQQYLSLLGENGQLLFENDECRLYSRNGEKQFQAKSTFSEQKLSANCLDLFAQEILSENKSKDSHQHLQHAAFIEACYRSHQFKTAVNPKSLLLAAHQIPGALQSGGS